MTRSSQQPIVLSFFACDMIWQDPETHKLFVLGMFSTLTPESLPWRHPGFHVFMALTDGRGRNRVSLKLVSHSDDSTIWYRELNVSFDDPVDAIEMSVAAADVVFETAGAYRLQLFVNGEYIVERRIFVLEPGASDGTEEIA